MFPIEIRSTLLGNIAIGTALAQLGIIQGYDFSFNKLGSSSPFLVGAVIDFLLFLSILVLFAIGLIENKFETKEKDQLNAEKR